MLRVPHRRWPSWLSVQADQPRSRLARRGEPQPAGVGQLGPREQLGDLRMPSSVCPRGPADRVTGHPPAPRRGGGGVCPIAAAGQPEPKRAGQDAPLHDPPGIVQRDHGIGLRIDHQLGVVGGHRRTPTASLPHRWRPRPGWRSWGPHRHRRRRVRGVVRPAASQARARVVFPLPAQPIATIRSGIDSVGAGRAAIWAR